MMNRRSGIKKFQGIGKFWLITGFVVIMLGFWVARLYKTRLWDGGSRFTVIDVENGTVRLNSFDPVTNQGISLTLPTALRIQTTHGRGVWTAGVMPKLGERFGNEWVADSISNTLGVTYTALRENLGWWDRFYWWYYSRGIRWRNVEISDTFFVKHIAETDGQETLSLAKAWDMKAKEWFLSAVLAQEPVEVVIVNTTQTSGLGNHAARFADSAGVGVAEVKTESAAIEKCILKGNSDMRELKTAKFLIAQFGCDWQTDRGERLEMRLGGDYYRKWMD